MVVYAVVSDQSDHALYLFVKRRMAERMVENGNRAGELHVQLVKLGTPLNRAE